MFSLKTGAYFFSAPLQYTILRTDPDLQSPTELKNRLSAQLLMHNRGFVDTATVLRTASQYFQSIGIRAEVVTVWEGEQGLRINPSQDGPLGRYASNLDRLFGTSVVYVPNMEGGLYRGTENMICIGNDAVLSGRVGSIEYHEALHARLRTMRAEGKYTPYHVEFASRNPDRSPVAGSPYGAYITAEEISTYTRDMTSEFSQAVRGNSNRERLLQTSVDVRQMASAVEFRSQEAIRSLGIPSSIQYTFNPAGSGLTGEWVVSIKTGDYTTYVPVGTEAQINAQRARLQGLVRDGIITNRQIESELHKWMREEARQRLQTLVETAKSAQRKALAISLVARDNVREAFRLVQTLNVEVNRHLGSQNFLSVASGADPASPFYGLGNEHTGNPLGIRGARRSNQNNNPNFDSKPFEDLHNRSSSQSTAPRVQTSPQSRAQTIRNVARDFLKDAFKFTSSRSGHQQLILRSAGPVSVGLTMMGIADLYKQLGYRLETLHNQMEGDRERCEQTAMRARREKWIGDLNRSWSCGESDQIGHAKVQTNLENLGRLYWNEYISQLKEAGEPEPPTHSAEYRKAGMAYREILFLIAYLDLRQDFPPFFEGACKYISLEIPNRWYSISPTRSFSVLVDFSKNPPMRYDLRTQRYYPTSKIELETLEDKRATNWPEESFIESQNMRLAEVIPALPEQDCRTENDIVCEMRSYDMQRSIDHLKLVIEGCQRNGVLTIQPETEQRLVDLHQANNLIKPHAPSGIPPRCPKFESQRQLIMSEIRTLIGRGLPDELLIGAITEAQEAVLSQRFRNFCSSFQR